MLIHVMSERMFVGEFNKKSNRERKRLAGEGDLHEERTWQETWERFHTSRAMLSSAVDPTCAHGYEARSR
jgi:hypothetical protein